MSSVMLATLYNIAPQLQVKFWCYNFMQCEIPDYLPNADPGAGRAVAEFKEFERRFKFKPRFKYCWFHLKLYQMFQDLSRRFI